MQISNYNSRRSPIRFLNGPNGDHQMGGLFKKIKKAVQKVTESKINVLKHSHDPSMLLDLDKVKETIKQDVRDYRDVAGDVKEIIADVQANLDKHAGKYFDPLAKHRDEEKRTKDELGERVDEYNKVVAQLEKDPTNSALLARALELEKTIGDLQGHLKKLSKRAGIVLQIVSIVASFFIPGIGPVLNQGVNMIAAGAVHLGKSLIVDTVLKALANKITEKKKQQLAEETANYAEQNKAMPDESWYENRVTELMRDEIEAQLAKENAAPLPSPSVVVIPSGTNAPNKLAVTPAGQNSSMLAPLALIALAALAG